MIVKQEIKLYSHIENYIDLLNEYKEIFEAPKRIQGRCIIHINPISDTRVENGDLEGYHDSIHCRYDIYDCENMTVYKDKRLHDRVHLFIPCRTGIYKDLSTMVIIDDGCSFAYHQEVEVHPYEQKYWGGMAVTVVEDNGDGKQLSPDILYIVKK